MKKKTHTNKHILFAGKFNITLNFPALDIPHSIGRKAGISKKLCLFQPNPIDPRFMP